MEKGERVTKFCVSTKEELLSEENNKLIKEAELMYRLANQQIEHMPQPRHGQHMERAGDYPA